MPGGKKKLNKGQIVCEPGFLSTTCDEEEMFSGRFEMIIKGHYGRYIEDYSTCDGEEEVLFPCYNYHRYEGKKKQYHYLREVTWREYYRAKLKIRVIKKMS